MSGFIGVFYTDGAPVNFELLNGLTSFETWPLWKSLRVVSLNYWLQRDSLSSA
jgi:hypothetical protein